MRNKKTKFFAKLLLSGFAIYLVYIKLDHERFLLVLKSLDLWYLVPAVVFFVLSKICTALRLNAIFRTIEVFISEKENFRLYAVGMFYNLFLPGGVGGDGYKVVVINKFLKTPVKNLVQAVLLDRLLGLAAIVVFLLIFSWWIELSLPIIFAFPKDLYLIFSIIVIPAFYLFQWILFRDFIASFLIGMILSFLGQTSQLICTYMILLALGITEGIANYQFVFLISSVATVIPITVGGIGIRELVFIYSEKFVEISVNSAVAFSLVFFMITALVSLSGALVKTSFTSSFKNS
ncbi:lysylphosphatidylglycerol synthase transmembrane domain-containing protein [Aquiflexum sp.]|uniref:lysylphosphatidylglycerol synthase transmembrane domain-containing protein n=1 Tax=Aquiflexum sp. TaxID=1872584 RepID=UPI0035943FE7